MIHCTLFHHLTNKTFAQGQTNLGGSGCGEPAQWVLADWSDCMDRIDGLNEYSVIIPVVFVKKDPSHLRGLEREDEDLRLVCERADQEARNVALNLLLPPPVQPSGFQLREGFCCGVICDVEQNYAPKPV